MSDIIRICGICMIALIMTLLIKQFNIALSKSVPHVTAVIVIISALTALKPIIQYIKNSLSSVTSSSDELISVLFKAVAIALISQLISEFCRENGENVLASSLEFAANAQILLLSLPIITELLNIIFKSV